MDLTADFNPSRPAELWATDPQGDPAAAHAHVYPPPGWPSLNQVTYTKEAVTTLFLLVALPVVLVQLLKRPRSAARGIAGKAAGV